MEKALLFILFAPLMIGAILGVLAVGLSFLWFLVVNVVNPWLILLDAITGSRFDLFDRFGFRP